MNIILFVFTQLVWSNRVGLYHNVSLVSACIACIKIIHLYFHKVPI